MTTWVTWPTLSGSNKKEVAMAAGLVVARKRDESVTIVTQNGERIKVLVVSGGNQVKLGFQANRSVTIYRTELEGQQLKQAAPAR